MCDFSGKLTAWLDHELSANDAADVERHLQHCPQCCEQIEAYGRVSAAFEAYCDAYCDAARASRPRHKLPRWVLTSSGAGAIAAIMAALFLLAPRARVQLSPVRAPGPAASTAIVSQAVQTAETPEATQPSPAAVKTVRRLERRKGAEQRGYGASRRSGQAENWPPVEPTVEIAFPADAIFPPGAVPAGVSFTADITIGPYGSAQQIRLRPQLAGFERRPTQP
jgi:hypothetical protein